jgi:hypothetical protein
MIERLELITTPNQDPLLSHIPIIGIDIWEHSYYIQYFNEKEKVRSDLSNSGGDLTTKLVLGQYLEVHQFWGSWEPFPRRGQTEEEDVTTCAKALNSIVCGLSKLFVHTVFSAPQQYKDIGWFYFMHSSPPTQIKTTFYKYNNT